MVSLSETLETNKTVFIAEIGQNHQGDFELASDYVRTFVDAGADIVKFQMRNNNYLFSKEKYDEKYNSENAFGDTYGEHREALELSKLELSKIQDLTHSLGALFMCTPFDELSLADLVEIEVDMLKVSSFDIGNLPLIDKIAKAQRPVAMSVGGAQHAQIKASVQQVLKHHDKLMLLHCVSEYPCPAENLGLNLVNELKRHFPDVKIGSSDHFNGILSGPIAYMYGARVFEKHVTLNRSNKGTDHSFALEPDGFKKFVRDVNRVELMTRPKQGDDLGKEPVFKKLGKSLIAAVDISKGELFTIDNVSGRIFSETYIPVRQSHEVIGLKAKRNFSAGEIIQI
jgi:N-acetylneuraminate synthase/sialic acid synthase